SHTRRRLRRLAAPGRSLHRSHLRRQGSARQLLAALSSAELDQSGSSGQCCVTAQTVCGIAARPGPATVARITRFGAAEPHSAAQWRVCLISYSVARRERAVRDRYLEDRPTALTPAAPAIRCRPLQE